MTPPVAPARAGAAPAPQMGATMRQNDRPSHAVYAVGLACLLTGCAAFDPPPPAARRPAPAATQTPAPIQTATGPDPAPRTTSKSAHDAPRQPSTLESAFAHREGRTRPETLRDASAAGLHNSNRDRSNPDNPLSDHSAANPYPYSGFRDAPHGGAAEGPPMGVGPVQQITFSPVGSDFDPVVTPDGTRLVYASTQHRHTADIYIKDLEGQVVTQLTSDPADDIMPSVSPDGSFIAFASNRAGDWNIYVAPIAGGKAVQITSDPADELHPSWSPDGDRIVYCRFGDVASRWELWVTRVTNPSVTHFIGFGMFPVWAPVAGTGADGADRILFQLTRDRGTRTFGVWTLDYKNGKATNPTELATSATSALINPTWSPDGTRVVYAEVPVNGDESAVARIPREAQLWVQNLDGTGRTRLTEGRAVALMPAWGRDDRIVFMSPRGGLENIWSLDAAPAILAAGPASKTNANAAKGAQNTGSAAAGTDTKAPTQTATGQDPAADAADPR